MVNISFEKSELNLEWFVKSILNNTGLRYSFMNQIGLWNKNNSIEYSALLQSCSWLRHRLTCKTTNLWNFFGNKKLGTRNSFHMHVINVHVVMWNWDLFWGFIWKRRVMPRRIESYITQKSRHFFSTFCLLILLDHNTSSKPDIPQKM